MRSAKVSFNEDDSRVDMYSLLLLYVFLLIRISYDSLLSDGFCFSILERAAYLSMTLSLSDFSLILLRLLDDWRAQMILTSTRNDFIWRWLFFLRLSLCIIRHSGLRWTNLSITLHRRSLEIRCTDRKMCLSTRWFIASLRHRWPCRPRSRWIDVCLCSKQETRLHLSASFADQTDSDKYSRSIHLIRSCAKYRITTRD